MRRRSASGWADVADLEERSPEGFGIPAIDGIGAALRLAEGIVGMELTSKVSTHAPPEQKKITGWPVSVALGLPSATGSDLNASSLS